MQLLSLFGGGCQQCCLIFSLNRRWWFGEAWAHGPGPRLWAWALGLGPEPGPRPRGPARGPDLGPGALALGPGALGLGSPSRLWAQIATPIACCAPGPPQMQPLLHFGRGPGPRAGGCAPRIPFHSVAFGPRFLKLP